MRALLILLPALFAMPALAMPIEEAVRMGLTIRPEVRAAELDAAAAGTDVKVAAGGFYPSVSVSSGPIISGLTGVTYEVTAAQMLYDWGHVHNQVEGAEALEHGLSQDLAVKRDTAALDIVATYLDVLAAQRERDADKRHIERLNEILEMTRSRSHAGYADSSEPARTDFELARANQQLASDEGKLTDSGNQFELVVGVAPDQMMEPAPQPVALYVEKNDLGSLIHEAPLYRKAIADAKYAETQYNDAESVLLPQLNLEASASRDDVGGIPEKQNFVGLRLRLATFQGISNFQKIDSARQRLESARTKQDSMERDLRRQVRSLFDQAAALKRQEAALRDQTERTDSLASLYREQFRVGRRDVVDLLNLQLERFQAERDLVDLHLQALRAQYQAAAQLGLIGPLLEGGLTP